MAINNIIGPPVEGENFYGREKELEFAWNQIQNGNSLVLSAPRRVGKSSFAKRLIKEAKQKGWNTLEIDLEEIQSEEGFIKHLIQKLQEESWWKKKLNKSVDLINQIIESVSFEYEGAKASFAWKNKNEEIHEKLKSLLNHEENTLIMIDELTVLLNSFIENDPENGKSNVIHFLNWLRSFRQVSGTKIRWIFCSSVGIENFLSHHNLSYTINDVVPRNIDEFSNEVAKDFIKELAKSESLEFSDDHIEYFLEKLGWKLPYFIQILFANIHQLVEIQGKTISLETIDEAYQILISENHLNTWYERLKEYKELEYNAKLILRNLSKIPNGESRDKLFNLLYAKVQEEEKVESILNDLLSMLKNDGYLMVTSDLRYIFRSPLLRDFWFNRFVQ